MRLMLIHRMSISCHFCDTCVVIGDNSVRAQTSKKAKNGRIGGLVSNWKASRRHLEDRIDQIHQREATDPSFKVIPDVCASSRASITSEDGPPPGSAASEVNPGDDAEGTQVNDYAGIVQDGENDDLERRELEVHPVRRRGGNTKAAQWSQTYQHAHAAELEDVDREAHQQVHTCP